MTRAFTLIEASDQLRVSKRWLQQFLATNAVDAAGLPFYYRAGRRKLFEEKDIQRIRDFLRQQEAVRHRPGPSFGGHSNVSADVLADLAVANVFGPRRTKPPQRRVRFPKARKPEPPAS